MKNQAHPIIVVKRRKAKSHGAAHGSWKIAYADFMTAMMAFFLVMWLIFHLQPKRVDSDCGVTSGLHWRQRLRAAIAFLIVKAQSPAVVMITPKARGSE